MYRGNRWVMAVIMGLFLIGIVNMTSVSAEETISYTDPAGDVENDGVGSEGEASADIASLSFDHSGDPLVMEMSVEGEIVYQGGDLYYDYYIYIDHTGDGEDETYVEVSNLYGMLFSSDYGDDQQLSSEVSGNGTSTLRVEIPTSWFTDSPGFSDVYASSDVTSSNFMYTASDYINEDFQGGGGGDDDTPPNLYLPPEEDPADATPSDESISVTIDDFQATYSAGSSQYQYEQEASGTGDVAIYKCAYTLVTYYKNGDPQFSSWETGPKETSQSYGGHTYEETFGGVDELGNWENWEWYFKSTGPVDSSSTPDYWDDPNYWEAVENVVFYVRAFDDEGDWNQDSMDVTDRLKVESGDDDTGDDDI